MYVCLEFMHFSLRRLAVKLSPGSRLNLDRLILRVKGGPAGAALPDVGGVGGDGGDVILESKRGEILTRLPRKYPELSFVGNAGLNSRKIKVHGDKGKPVIINVPMGVEVTDEDGQKLGELNKNNERLIIAKGAAAGTADTKFKPEKVGWKHIRLDLRLIADVGFVGFPNAGKSTLLRALSRAKPKVSSFPFTTLRPEVGILQYDDYRSICAADLPGLIEGAYRNVGLGHEFLKHVQRTSILLIVVDVSGFQLNSQSPFRDAFHTVLLLNKELELYDSDMLSKPAILCINKMDLVNSQSKADNLIRLLQSPKEWRNLVVSEDILPEKQLIFREIFQISALNRESVGDLKLGIRRVLDDVTPLKTVTPSKDVKLNTKLRQFI